MRRSSPVAAPRGCSPSLPDPGSPSPCRLARRGGAARPTARLAARRGRQHRGHRAARRAPGRGHQSRSCCGPPTAALDDASSTTSGGTQATSARSSAARTAPSRRRTAPRRSGSSRSQGSDSDDVAERGRRPARRPRADAPDGVTAQVTGPAGDPGRPRRGLRRRRHPAAARDRRRRGGAADPHLPQPGPVAGPARRGRRRRPAGRGARDPGARPRSAWPGTSRRSASSRCWSSAPAPTTRCC